MGLSEAVRNVEGRPVRAHERRLFSVPMAATTSTPWVEARPARRFGYEASNPRRHSVECGCCGMPMGNRCNCSLLLLNRKGGFGLPFCCTLGIAPEHLFANPIDGFRALSG